ncbi:MAG: hypothetical protein ACM3X9_00770 [Bacillota bacterium]
MRHTIKKERRITILTGKGVIDIADLEITFEVENIPVLAENLKDSINALEGVNHVEINAKQKKLILGYTPGIANVRLIKEIIEESGAGLKEPDCFSC